jgi:dihydroflavonol-4-reductase
MLELNPTGTDLVLGAAHRAGLDPIVNLSTISAFYPMATGLKVSKDFEVAFPQTVYAKSKALSETVAPRY